MDVHIFWKVLFTLYSIRSMLGCDVFARALDSFPKYVIVSEESLNRSQADFTDNFITCLPNKRDGSLICNNNTNDGTENKTIAPDLGYTFQVDHLGKVISICFNFTVREIIGECFNYVQLVVTITETNDIELDQVLTPDSDEMRIYILFDETNCNNPRLYKETAVTQAGSFEKFRIGQKAAQVFTLKQCDRSGNCIILNENVTIKLPVDKRWLYTLLLGVTVTTTNIMLIYRLKAQRARDRLHANQQQQVPAV